MIYYNKYDIIKIKRREKGIFDNSNTSENLNILDAITITGFLAQLDNMAKDDVQNKYIHTVIKAIADEIEKLHRENDIIMEQNEEILKLLEDMKDRS